MNGVIERDDIVKQIAFLERQSDTAKKESERHDIIHKKCEGALELARGWLTSLDKEVEAKKKLEEERAKAEEEKAKEEKAKADAAKATEASPPQ